MSNKRVWSGHLEFLRKVGAVMDCCHREESAGIEVFGRFGSVVNFLEMGLEVWILPKALVEG